MKKFTRVLAMLLALVTVLAVLPISALADNWLNVEADKTQDNNVTSTDITVTVDPKALLSYIQNGDVKGLLKGMSASGSLGDVLTKEEILAILPEEDIVALAKSIIADIDAKDLLACLDADELLACVDTEGLISLLKEMDLKSYVKDVDILMNYVDKKDIEAAIAYIDTDALVNDYASVLMDLALELDPADLFAVVDINKAVKLNGIDVEAAANLDYIKNVIGYATLASKYADRNALEAFLEANAERFAEEILQNYIKNGVRDIEELLADGIFTVSELIANDVISVDELAADYGYANLVKTDLVKDQITAGIANATIASSDVVACLESYDAAIDAIGFEDAVAAVGGYKTVIKYVTNFKALVNTFDVKAIAKAIIRDRVITKVIDAEGLIKAINVRAFVNKVDAKQLVAVVYNSGIAQELLGMLDIESYLVQVFSIVATMQQTITEIEIDGVVVTTQNEEGYIKLLPARLVDSFENLVPTLNELANLDDSGKLFTASFAVSYLDGEVEKTKEINFNFVLTAGIDMIRTAAAKLSYLLGKVGYVGLADGKLVADVTVPSEFASVMRLALEALADSSDPEMNALKDKVLAIYNQTPDDFIAFTQELTIEEIIAVLEAVDPALFGKVYGKALASRYAEVLLSYVERVTGYDFSDNLEAQNLVNTLATIPTFEVFVEKLEAVTGKEITDRLPAKVNGYFDHTVYDVIDKLGDVAGYDFDMQNLLKQAAASTDPFAFLYTAVVDKAENAAGVYNFVKRNSIRVANRLLATRFGAVIADNCLMDFYAGNSTFVFAKTVTFDAKVLAEKAIDKAINFVTSYVSIGESKKDMIKEALLLLLEDGSAYMTTGFDVSVHVNNLYSVTYTTANGATILTTLLPAGTDLSKMVDYTTVEGFNGWVDVATGEIITKMPAKDVTLKADITVEEPEDPDEPVIPEEKTYTITLVVKNEKGEVVGTKTFEKVQEGIALSVYRPDLAVAVESFYPALTDAEAILGYAYGFTWDEAVFDANVTADVVITAELYLDKNTENAAFQIEGLVNGVDYEIVLTDDACTVLFAKNWNELIADKNLAALRFAMATDFVAALNRNLVLVAEGAQKVTLNAKMLAQLAFIGTDAGANTIGLSYAPATAFADLGLSKDSGAVAAEFVFDFAGVLTDIGNFENGAEVEIVLPFAGIDTDDAKTFVYMDSDVVDATVTAEAVTFKAPHFSTVTLVNKYYLDVKTEYGLVGIDPATIDATKLPVGPIATAADVASGWYEAGKAFVAEFKGATLQGVAYEKTQINGVDYDNQGFVMPAEAVTVEHFAKARVYNVYYYVNGALNKTVSYTIFDANATTVESILGYKPTTADGWYWFDQDSVGSKLGVEDISLFWVNNNETKITVNFKVNEETVKSYEKTIAEWRDGELAALKLTIDREVPGYIWKDMNGKLVTDYTIKMLVESSGTIDFHGTVDNRNYSVYTDGNATVDKTDALAGTEITVTVTNKFGYTYEIKVYTTVDGTTPGDAVAVEGGKFVMPSSNVIVTVTYTANPITYKDKDGNNKTGAYGDVNEIVVTVPAGSVLNATDLTTLASAPAGLALSKVARGTDGSLILTYRYTLTEAVDESAFLAEVALLIAEAQYVTTWIVNGVAYNSELEAMNAQLPEGATIVGWSQMSQNVKVAIIEYTAPATVSAWLIVCIVLAVLLLIAIIALIYVLHVTDKIATSWLTKVCAAIVGAFFAFCMFLAKITLKVLNFMGIKTEDMLEDLPEEEPVEDIPAVLIDTEALVEEATEEAVEEAVVEEVAEEAPAEEATEEVVEAVVEETPAEEATEEVVEAVVEETPAEEATEEVVEAVVEEAPAEEATEEVVEAVVEETPAEEATEEVVEAVVEEAPAEEAAEEVAEEAPVEEATEEAVEETVEEEVAAEEEAVEEAVAEEAPVEEATEETAEEAAEEEKKDE